MVDKVWGMVPENWVIAQLWEKYIFMPRFPHLLLGIIIISIIIFYTIYHFLIFLVKAQYEYMYLRETPVSSQGSPLLVA